MWILLAIMASVIWGLCYSVDEQVFKRISVPTFMFLSAFTGLVITGIVSLASGKFYDDIEAMRTDAGTFWLVVTGILCATLAGFLILISIQQGKNATLAALLEVSYPIFTVVFSLILFGHNTLNWSTILGGALIFSGVFLIASSNL
jgi:drug/metabolite transporter (DMT)-like permease